MSWVKKRGYATPSPAAPAAAPPVQMYDPNQHAVAQSVSVLFIIV